MNVPHKKLQSAMEYLMTYGWAILIIAVVIGVLYAMGIFNSSGLLGSFCTAQTGYFCANPILSTNSPTLNVTIGQDTRLEWPAWRIFAVRGTAFNASSPNITGSGAFYNGEKQIVTIPLNSILGNYIPIGTPFSGSLWAEYCNTPNCNTPDQVSEIGIFYTKAAKLGYVTTSVSTSSISTTSTSSTTTTSITTPAPTTTITPSGIIYSVPITLTNSQSSNTPAPFQQMVNISESTYSSYLTYNGNFANFEYYTLSGNTVSVLPAWIESSNSGKLITWVKLPDGIPAESNTIIYLGFASTSNNLLSSTGTTGIGEAPQLSSTYGQYDDGANVFLAYGAFQGSSLPSGWSLAGSGSFNGGNNGVYLSNYGSWGDVYTSISNLPSNTITETSYTLDGPSDAVGDYIVQGSNIYIIEPSFSAPYSSGTTTGIWGNYEFWSGYNNEPSINYYSSSTSNSNLKLGTYPIGGYTYFYTQSIRSDNQVILNFYKSSSMVKTPVYSNWTGNLVYTGTLPVTLPTSGTFGISSWEGTPPGPGPNYVLWTRVRTEPPNNAMPTVTFG